MTGKAIGTMTNHGETGSTTITTTPNPGNPQNGNKTTMIGNPTTQIHGAVGKSEMIDMKMTMKQNQQMVVGQNKVAARD